MQTEQTKNQILEAVSELQCVADPSVIQKTLNEVLIEWLGETELDSSNRGRITCLFRAVSNFLDDIVEAEA